MSTMCEARLQDSAVLEQVAFFMSPFSLTVKARTREAGLKFRIALHRAKHSDGSEPQHLAPAERECNMDSSGVQKGAF